MVDSGERDLYPVLCLHSLFLDPRAFDQLVAAGRESFSFVVPELLGQAGRVEQARATVTMDDVTDDVLARIDDLGLTRIAVVAQSMGGDVAVRLATRRPQLVERLVLMGASARAESPQNITAFAPLCDRIEAQGFDEEIVDVVSGILFARSVLDDPSRADDQEVWRSRLAALRPGLAHAVRGVVERPDVRHLLPAVTARTLVVSGVEDLARPPAWSDEMFDAIPDAELWRIKGAGHTPLLEAPQRVVPRVLDFLRVDGPAAA